MPSIASIACGYIRSTKSEILTDFGFKICFLPPVRKPFPLHIAHQFFPSGRPASSFPSAKDFCDLSMTCFLVLERSSLMFLPFGVRCTSPPAVMRIPCAFTSIFFSIRSTTPVMVGPSRDTRRRKVHRSTMPSSDQRVKSTSN